MKGGGGQVRIFDSVPGELWWEYPIVLRDYILRENVLDMGVGWGGGGACESLVLKDRIILATQIIPNSRSFK